MVGIGGMAKATRRELENEIARLRAERNTWELAALAGLIRGLDAATVARVGERMRAIVFGGGVQEVQRR